MAKTRKGSGRKRQSRKMRRGTRRMKGGDIHSEKTHNTLDKIFETLGYTNSEQDAMREQMDIFQDDIDKQIDRYKKYTCVDDAILYKKQGTDEAIDLIIQVLTKKQNDKSQFGKFKAFASSVVQSYLDIPSTIQILQELRDKGEVKRPCETFYRFQTRFHKMLSA